MKRSIYFFVVITLFVITGCTGRHGDDYTSLVKDELAKRVRHDSMFLGISLGMTSKSFFSHCWELNKTGVISDGANNTMVLYKIDTGLKSPASMNFYPDFYKNKIYNMRVTFQYNAWAPWNKALFADSLLPDVLHLYEKWYSGGNNFMAINDKKKGTIYVKVDGNRRITLGRFDDMIVKANFTDLLIEKELKK